jgi:hypothetical protein
MKKLLLSALIIGSFAGSASAGPAAKLARRLGIPKSQARVIIQQGIAHRSGGAAPAVPGAPSVTQGIPMGAGSGPAR